MRVDDDIAKLYEEVRAASAARLKWETYEKKVKADLLERLGYDPDDDKPEPTVATDAAGAPLFKVDVTYRDGFDKKRLRTHYPAAFADCETKTPVKTIRPANTDS
ncbi:hypothetical protein [Streptomyces sp. NBC_00687]|uniref:hypothetical protein n=1 Tax=Streptomyces sp. NBC_00687 TaxID=2975807 RepID=UPI0022541842|nr:hypothetical protein [Streptomyces sp. NBC_00687]MCX4912878.1 hypothetical protein [Streptomyces sp. NBC_00687]